MVHPDDDVALRVAREADAERLAVRIEHDQRRRRVEADPLDRCGRQPRLRQRLADRSGAGLPDIL